MNRTSRPHRSVGRTIVILIAAGVLLYALYGLWGVLDNYRRSREEYDEIRKEATIIPDSSSDETPEGTGHSEARPLITESSWGYTPGTHPDIDFDRLKKINPDIAAWFYMPAFDLSYPIMQGSDNDEYLHRTYEGTYAYAGSIFMASQNSRDFSDPNTVVYGHNMRDKSMFGHLRDLYGMKAGSFNPYIWILTPDGNYCYRMFSLRHSGNTGVTYTLFYTRDQRFPDWITDRIKESELTFDPLTPSADDYVLSLSTCDTDHVHRRIVHAVRVLEENTTAAPGLTKPPYIAKNAPGDIRNAASSSAQSGVVLSGSGNGGSGEGGADLN